MIVLFLAFSIPPDWVYLNAKTVQDGHTQRGIEMDNKVLDKAVEVAVVAYWEDCANGPGYEDSYTADRGHMRAALLAGVKVLLGEPVACDVLAPDGSLVAGKVSIDYADDILRRYEWDNCHKSNFLYAPSLGEGDGR